MAGARIALRPAVAADKRVVWVWRNDPDTRRMMKNTELIPWETHSEWFDRVLQSPSRILVIGEVQRTAPHQSASRRETLGMIRFDQQPSCEDAWEVSINLQADWRHKGYGSQLLVQSIEWLTRQRPDVRVLFAQIGRANLPSISCFQKAGFQATEPSRWFPNLRDHDFDAQADCYYEKVLG